MLGEENASKSGNKSSNNGSNENFESDNEMKSDENGRRLKTMVMAAKKTGKMMTKMRRKSLMMIITMRLTKRSKWRRWFSAMMTMRTQEE